ncbi:MAG: ThuA domain-containing protein [Pirellulaceae bacterium]|jgi:hypothetical protein|nr:ThuA domain-containing protein [Pirellulaceae bacterium]
MKRVTWCTLVLAVIVGAGQFDSAAGESIAEGKIRVLLVTGGHAFERKPFFSMFDAIPDVVYTEAAFPAAAELLRPELAREYDVIVFYDMWAQGIAPKKRESFVELLRSGIGVVALHHTLAAHENWPEYAKIIGGKYHLNNRVVNGETIAKSGFQHHQDIQVRIANRDHPIVRGLDDFEIHDETWNTLVIRAVENRHIIFLNGKKLVDVRDDTSRHGRIGFQVHAGDQFAKMRVLVKEVTLRPL